MQAFLSLLFNFCVIVMVLRDVQFYYFTIQCETADTVIYIYFIYQHALPFCTENNFYAINLVSANYTRLNCVVNWFLNFNNYAIK